MHSTIRRILPRSNGPRPPWKRISISWQNGRNSSKSPTAPRTGGAWWQSTLQTSWPPIATTRSAEKAAERKAGLKRRQPAQRGAAQTRTQRYTAAQAYGGYTVPQLYPPSFPQLQQTASGAGQSVRRAGGSAGTIQRVSVGPCFACGEMGHLRMYCPKIQTQEKK